MGVIRSMRSPRRCSALVCVLWVWLAAAAEAQTGVATFDKATIGGDSLSADVFRILGLGNVGSGSGTINPLAIDNLGDVRKDTTTTITTAGAHTWSAAGSFTSTLGVTGVLSGNTGTLLLGSPTRISGSLPSFLLHESDQAASAKYWAWEADAGSLYLRLYDDTPSSSNAAVRLDRSSLVPGDWRWGSLLATIRPESNGGSSLGTIAKKYLTLHAWELWVQTLVAQQTIATIGGRILVAPTTELTRDLASSDTCIFLKHNDTRANDTVMLQANGAFEMILIGASPVDCSISGNCAVAGSDYATCTITRNRDGSGANDWSAGAAVVNTGNVGDGTIDIYSQRSYSSEGYPGQVVSDGPIGFWRMNETTSTTSADVMGVQAAATEGGTQSNGLGVTGVANLGTTGADPTWQNTGAAGRLTVASSSSLQITGDLTLEWIMFWENDLTRNENVISHGGNLGDYHVQVQSDGALQFCHGNGSVNECETTAAGVVPVDQWHHYAIVRDATSSPKRVLFYKDGTLVTSSTYTQTVTTSGYTLAFGANSESPTTNNVDGYLDEIAVYNYQLSADRIRLHSEARTNDSISKFTIGPTLCGNVRTGTSAFAVAERWCLGNLAGTYGYASSPTAVYGLASGDASATWVSIDATNGFRIMNGSTVKTSFDTSGNGSLTGDLAIGTSGSLRSGATAYDTATGYWLDYNGGTPRFRIGTTTGAATPSYLRWTGTALEVRNDTLTIDANGIKLEGGTGATAENLRSYRFDFGDSFTNGLYSYGSSVRQMDLILTRNGAGRIEIGAFNTSGADASIVLSSQNGATASRITFDVADIYVGASQGFTGTCAALPTVVDGIITSC